MLANVRRTRQRFGSAIDLVATGGIDSPEKAAAALREGATAVGYFTAFVTRGPLLARRILEHLLRERAGRAVAARP
jgi:dihydroorotate dehydrogenase